jgi:hypothetical protein
MSNPVDLEKIKMVRNIEACDKHLRISAGLKEYGHIDAQYSNSAIYWGNVCDDCANQIVVGQKA